SSARLSELFCCLLNAQRCRVQAVAIAFERFFLHESDDFCLVTLRKERPQLSLKITDVVHGFSRCLSHTVQRSTLAPTTPRCVFGAPSGQGGRASGTARSQESLIRHHFLEPDFAVARHMSR